MSEYLSAADFLKGILGEEEDVTVPGLGVVRIRPLTTPEVGRIYSETQDTTERMAIAVGMAMVEPKLTDEQARTMVNAAGGRMLPLVQRVMTLAGVIDGEALDSLAGAGS